MAKPLLQRDVELVEKINEKLADYDYVRFVFSDLSGVSRGKLVPVRHAAKALEGDLAWYSGIPTMGPLTELVFPERLHNIRMGNALFLPDLQSLHPIPWVGDGTYKFAEMMLTSYWLEDMTPQTAGPRFVALQQLDRLDKLGFRLYSAAEQEFNVSRKCTPPQPVFDGNMFSTSILLSRFSGWLAEVDQNLKKAGVDIKIMHTEYGPGEFEMATSPASGIKGADLSFIMKQGIKEMAEKRDWLANFMAIPWLGKVGSGSHFNFSVFEKDSNRNAFYDETSTDNLSGMAHHWLAGMIKHCKALTALCCSSTNCYRRLHTPWVPTVSNWGRQDRQAMVRVKTGGDSGTYMENRLPSSLASPYHVMAATIAAGLDGVINHLECPPEHFTENATKLPTTLEEALQGLQQDTEMVEALGAEFVECFVKVKQEVDLKAIEGLTDPEQIQAKEFEQYAIYA